MQFVILVKMLGSMITFNVNSKYSRVYCESCFCWVGLVLAVCREIRNTKGTIVML
jgi:hypothetical protein